MNGRLKQVLVWVVAIAAIAFVLVTVPFHDRCTDAGCTPGLLTTLRSMSVPYLVPLFAIYLGSTLVWAARWRSLLGIAGVDVPLLRVWSVTLESQAGGILLPGGIAGDTLRVAYVRSARPSARLSGILASVFADRLVGLVSLCALATVSALALGTAGVERALPFVASIPIGAAGAWVLLRTPRIQALPFLRRGPLARIVEPVLEYAGAESGPSALRRGLGLSVLVSLAQLVVVRGLLAALGVQPTNEAWVFVGGTFAMMVGAVPALPGAWGTADMAYVLFLSRAGVPGGAAAAVCLLYRMFWYGTGLLGALLSLRGRSRMVAAK
jgi:uncharacterized membrane protein YbhN (UPF0104 family)